MAELEQAGRATGAAGAGAAVQMQGGGGPGKATLPETHGEGSEAVHAAAAQGVSGSGGALPFADQIQKSFGPDHDVSGIKAHVGGAAEGATQRMGAEAYATRNQIAFRQAPSLHTAAHEAAHVVQQQAGVQLLGGVGKANDSHEQNADAVADRVVAGQSAADLLPKGGGAAGGGAVQMRRVATDVGATLNAPGQPAGTQGANYAASSAGARRMIEMAEQRMTPAQKAQVTTAMLAGQTQAVFDALPEPTRLTRHADAIRTTFPQLALGDPNLIDTGPRPATADAANITALCTSANAIFDAVAAGTHDTDIDQVFGHANRAAAKAKYAAAKTSMNTLKAGNHIVTDRSGYNAEVALGGLTGFNRQISLMPSCIDTPADVESIITMIHESMHAGNSDVHDFGYIGTQVFTQLPEAVKLTNAAHFEVIPRRILGAANAYAGQTFTPAGAAAAGGAPAAPPLTPLQTAVREASEQLRTAWTCGLNLHTLFDQLYKNQATWTTASHGGSPAQGMPYLSKVEKMTIHLKTTIDPASADPAKKPISQIDMAISEGVTRNLAAAMFEAGRVPNDAAGAGTYLTTNSGLSAAAITAAQAAPGTHRELWIKTILRKAGSVTGTVDRDARVVTEMNTLIGSWGTVLAHRDPNGFPA